MKKVLLFFILLTSITLTAQNDPVLIIDNVNITFKTGVSLPYWLKAGQTVDLGTNAKSASIIEFTVASNNLVFSQAISLTTSQTVPANKVWKIEGIGVTTQNSYIPTSNGLSSSGSSTSSTSNLPTIFQSPKKFETVGTYSWTVPPSVTSICVEVWGAGGGGSYDRGGGGGGGGYSYQCFNVIPGTNYIVTVGAGGGSGTNGGTSSLGVLINATGGGGGNSSSGGSGGIGTYMNGGNGDAIMIGYNSQNGGIGGNGGMGGLGGAPSGSGSGYPGGNGQSPGGGGGSGAFWANGGSGARGQVYIYW